LAVAALASDSAAMVFGGSTTFGHGVPGDATISHYLGQLDADHVYLNFGVNAYDSQREVDRLVYLLQLGYRPSKVVFVDGLNDMMTFFASPYRAVDKPRSQLFFIDRGELALNFGSPAFRNMLMAFAYAMPITHLYTMLKGNEPTVDYGSLDANKDKLDYRSIAWHYQNRMRYGTEHIEEIAVQWVDYYAENIRFVNGLADAFGFDVQFVLQPLGILDRNNPFIRKLYFDNDLYKVTQRFYEVAGGAIESGELGMVDCREALTDVDSAYAYVDATHYSPAGNLAVAECIAKAY
jgi:hypothetical protein